MKPSVINIITFAVISGLQSQGTTEAALFSNLGPCPPLPDFPPTSTYTLRPFKTYSSDVVIPFSYFSSPRDASEVLSLVNWAKNAGYRVRGVGQMHSWSPVTLSKYEEGTLCPKFLLVDTTKYLTGIKVTTDFNTSLHSVTLGPGVTLRRLLETLESHQLGIFSSPAQGDLSVGGMLAVGAHGSGIKTTTHSKSLGHSYGTFSNLVLEMDVIGWDNDTEKYVVKTLPRSHPDTKAFLVNLGRTFVTRVKIRVGADQMLRSQSFFTTVRQLFGRGDLVRDGDKPNLADYLDSFGRIQVLSLETGSDSGVLLFGWHSEPEKPAGSRLTKTPYNYIFGNYLPGNKILKWLLARIPHIWRFFARLSFPINIAVSSLAGYQDYWGLSKNHLLYNSKYVPIIRPNSFVLVTSRQNFQTVVSIIRKGYDDLASEWHSRGEYPDAGSFDIRVCGVEDPENILAQGAEPPIFSPAKPVPSHPEYDIVIWFEFGTYPETRKAQEFVADWQSLLYRDIHHVYGVLRVEWAKGWGHTWEKAWSNETIFDTLPRVLSSSDELKEWNLGVEILDRYDPWRIFSNGFLDRILIKA
ncbi:uncharacterized protein LOC118433976 [Folsomia candida]|uniref:Putative L-gulonolactone oxidase 4 n=1 Tax=Folsomia candida TaxID=158441 RepID=A0A226F325_FOLCA|nr:uncharacterized protein LOC118433976 [Folsomia candida]OXA63847.1 putative L-gulonolactone oxidase 4 [Folsomia candida]